MYRHLSIHNLASLAMSTLAALTIRDARDADVARIRDIYAHHVLHGLASFEEQPPSLEEMARRRQDLLGKALPCFVAEAEGRVLGYAYANHYRPRIAYRFTLEDSVYIDPDAIGRGVGRRLLDALLARATALGYRQMVAVIGDSDHQASIGLHRRAGFELIGILPAVGFKFGRWVDSVLMQRALGAGSATLPAASA
jgi:L-amino acid N-acyltransferase YncA